MNRIDPNLKEFLETHQINSDYHEHPPVFTVEESQHIKAYIPWTHTKNLFLTDKKWSYYLISIQAEKRFPINLFRKHLQKKEVSFASPEELFTKTRLTPWSVSLFGLIYDPEHHIQVYLDTTLRTSSHVGRHPNRNDATLILEQQMIQKFLSHTWHTTHIIWFDEENISLIDTYKKM